LPGASIATADSLILRSSPFRANTRHYSKPFLATTIGLTFRRRAFATQRTARHSYEHWNFAVGTWGIKRRLPLRSHGMVGAGWLLCMPIAYALPLACVGLILRLCEWSWEKPRGNMGSTWMLVASAVLFLPPVVVLLLYYFI
jgi:hypothetical protein